MSQAPYISHKERIYVRAAAIRIKLRGQDVVESILHKAILDATGNDETKVNVRKISSAIYTKKHICRRNCNPYFFVPFVFPTTCVPSLISQPLLQSLISFCDSQATTRNKKIIKETLPDSSSDMW